MRWLKAQAVGGSEEAAARAVAKSEGKSIDVVRHSIRLVSAYRARNDKSNFDFAMRDVLTSTAAMAKESLAGLLSAMELVEVSDAKTGKKRVISVEDKTTRLEAIRVFNSLLGNLQPKVPLIHQDISQTNQTANISGGAGSAETTEERLRRLRKASAEHRLLPAEVVGVPQHIDEETDPDDEEGDGEEVDE